MKKDTKDEKKKVSTGAKVLCGVFTALCLALVVYVGYTVGLFDKLFPQTVPTPAPNEAIVPTAPPEEPQPTLEFSTDRVEFSIGQAYEPVYLTASGMDIKDVKIDYGYVEPDHFYWERDVVSVLCVEDGYNRYSLDLLPCELLGEQTITATYGDLKATLVVNILGGGAAGSDGSGGYGSSGGGGGYVDNDGDGVPDGGGGGGEVDYGDGGGCLGEVVVVDAGGGHSESASWG